VNEFGAELDGVGQTLIANSENSSADPVARFQDDRSNAAIFEYPHRCQTSDSSADDYDIHR